MAKRRPNLSNGFLLILTPHRTSPNWWHKHPADMKMPLPIFIMGGFFFSFFGILFVNSVQFNQANFEFVNFSDFSGNATTVVLYLSVSFLNSSQN